MRLFIDGEEVPDDGPMDLSYSTLRVRDGDMYLTTKGPCIGGPLDGQIRPFQGPVTVVGPDGWMGTYIRVRDTWEWHPRDCRNTRMTPTTPHPEHDGR